MDKNLRIIGSEGIERALPRVLSPCWGTWPKISASVRMSGESELLHLRFAVEEMQLRRMVVEHNGPVWEDSAVELLLGRADSGEYLYLGFSASGKINGSWGTGGEERTLLDAQVLDEIPYIVTILENSNEKSRWRADITLNLETLGVLDTGEQIEEVALRGNVAKRGEAHRVPHYLLLSEIPTLEPELHLSQHFISL